MRKIYENVMRVMATRHQEDRAMAAVDWLARRLWITGGAGRWMSVRLDEARAEMRDIERCREKGIFGVAIDGDCLALRWQQLHHREYRVRKMLGGRGSHGSLRRAALAHAVQRDVRLYLRPPGDEGELWDIHFSQRWYDAPVQSVERQNMEDRSWLYTETTQVSEESWRRLRS